MSTMYKSGDRVIIQGRKYPGVVIQVNVRDCGCERYTVRTDDNRSLFDIPADALELCKDQVIKYVEKELEKREDNKTHMYISLA